MKKKKDLNWKTKAVILKTIDFFLDIIMHILLAKCEFDGWFHFVKNKELQDPLYNINVLFNRSSEKKVTPKNILATGPP